MEMILTYQKLFISGIILFIYLVIFDSRVKTNKSLSAILVSTMIYLLFVSVLAVLFKCSVTGTALTVLTCEVITHIITYYTIKNKINKWRRK